MPDPDDRHVLAAAIECKASLIITWNTKDFRSKILEPFGVQAVSPDDFILDQIDLNSELVLEAVNSLKDSYRNPAYTWEEFLNLLSNQRLTQTADQIRDLLDKAASGVSQFKT